MEKCIHCDAFRKEQYVHSRQLSALYDVYVASRDERKGTNGVGCAVTDLLTGETRKMRLDELKKLGLRDRAGKKVRTFKLANGVHYTFKGLPFTQDWLTFIVPLGAKYGCVVGDAQLPPAKVILFDGKQQFFIDAKPFRKMFIMSPNPVSSGQAKTQSMTGMRTAATPGNPAFNSVPQPQRMQNMGVQQSANRGGMSGAAAALAGLDPNAARQVSPQRPVPPSMTQNYALDGEKKSAPYVITRQVYYQGRHWGYELTDGVRCFDASEADCIKRVAQIRNAKYVGHGGSGYMQGLGGTALKNLPIKNL